MLRVSPEFPPAITEGTAEQPGSDINIWAAVISERRCQMGQRNRSAAGLSLRSNRRATRPDALISLPNEPTCCHWDVFPRGQHEVAFSRSDCGTQWRHRYGGKRAFCPSCPSQRGDAANPTSDWRFLLNVAAFTRASKWSENKRLLVVYWGWEDIRKTTVCFWLEVLQKLNMAVFILRFPRVYFC